MADLVAEGEKSTSDMLGESRKTLYSDSDPNPEVYTVMRAMFDLLTQVDSRLSAIEKNTSALEQVNQTLDTLKLDLCDKNNLHVN